ncbi:MAG: trehalose-phosphatase [Candidatus Omnitrophica bacterium]|nr:trehalose-phosphatase [Candidatus Omnitrophota bacterium]
MKDMKKHWQSVWLKIKKAKNLLVLSDFDGTLSRIVKHPGLARADGKAVSSIALLSGLKGVTTGIISGRPLKDVKRLVKIKGIFYVGNHGFELEYIDKKGGIKLFIHPEIKKTLPLIKKIADRLRRDLRGIKGVLVENKVYSLSLHYRMTANEDVKTLKKKFWAAVKEYRDEERIKVTRGKMVFEVRPPAAWNKGSAVLKIKRIIEKDDLLTIYLGDDKTDEDVFKILEKKDIGVLIGRRKKSNAAYRIKDVRGVAEFLSNVYQLRVN